MATDEVRLRLILNLLSPHARGFSLAGWQLSLLEPSLPFHFGIGSLLTPLLMPSMPTAEAVAVLSIPHAWATAVRWVRLRSDVHMPTFKQFGLASAIGGLAGAACNHAFPVPCSRLCSHPS